MPTAWPGHHSATGSPEDHPSHKPGPLWACRPPGWCLGTIRPASSPSHSSTGGIPARSQRVVRHELLCYLWILAAMTDIRVNSDVAVVRRTLQGGVGSARGKYNDIPCSDGDLCSIPSCYLSEQQSRAALEDTCVPISFRSLRCSIHTCSYRSTRGCSGESAGYQCDPMFPGWSEVSDP